MRWNSYLKQSISRRDLKLLIWILPHNVFEVLYSEVLYSLNNNNTKKSEENTNKTKELNCGIPGLLHEWWGYSMITGSTFQNQKKKLHHLIDFIWMNIIIFVENLSL